MAVILDGSYKILSLVRGTPPLGVLPIIPAWQNIRVNGPVQQWVVRKASDTTYRLSVGGYAYTGIIANNVNATVYADQDEEWQITYWEAQGAYTITRAVQTSSGWTVSDNVTDSPVSIKPIAATNSNPPQFSLNQLFLIQPANE